MERGSCGVDALEIVWPSELVGHAEAVELVLEERARAGDREDDLAGCELVGELGERLASRVVDVVDRLCIQDEPPRPVGDVDEGEDLLGEPLGVGVEDPDREPVDDESRLGDRSRVGSIVSRSPAASQASTRSFGA